MLGFRRKIALAPGWRVAFAVLVLDRALVVPYARATTRIASPLERSKPAGSAPRAKTNGAPTREASAASSSKTATHAAAPAKAVSTRVATKSPLPKPLPADAKKSHGEAKCERDGQLKAAASALAKSEPAAAGTQSHAAPARPADGRGCAHESRETPARAALGGRTTPGADSSSGQDGRPPASPLFLARVRATPADRDLAIQPSRSSAEKPHENAYLEIPDRAYAESTLAFHYANLSDDAAYAELERRRIAWTPATPPFAGVRSPIRLNGPLHGVLIHSSLPPSARATSVFEILDARLALALDDFCTLLARHDIVEIVHYNLYRPPGAMPADSQRQIRHPAGLAIDIGAFRKQDGTLLAVGPHWPSSIGSKTCGEGAVEHWAREARELVSIVCEATDERIFHFALTPDFDAAHADHVHLEIKPETRWFIVN